MFLLFWSIYEYCLQVIIRNNITDQEFRFNCGRSFGRRVEDGALERVLVAEPIRRDPFTPEDDSPTAPIGPTNGMVSKLMSSSAILNQLANGGHQNRPQSPANSTVSDISGRHHSNTTNFQRQRHAPGNFSF